MHLRPCTIRSLFLSLLTLAALGLASCAESLPVVDRVQPGAVEKSVFEGEWYFLQTVVDAPHTIEWTIVGEQSLLEKVSWEIDENYLIARRSYEFIDGGEGPGVSGTGEEGAPIAIFVSWDYGFGIY